MRHLKAFAITFFLCSLIVFAVNLILSNLESDKLWITAEQDEVTVSVKDDRSVWQDGIVAGVGDRSFTDSIRLTHISQMDAEGAFKATFTVIDDQGRTASFIRTIHFSDYEPPTFTLLKSPVILRNSEFEIGEMVMVSDPVDGDITHLVQIIDNDLDTSVAGAYDVLLTVKNSFGITVDYKLTIEVI